MVTFYRHLLEKTCLFEIYKVGKQSYAYESLSVSCIFNLSRNEKKGSSPKTKQLISERPAVLGIAIHALTQRKSARIIPLATAAVQLMSVLKQIQIKTSL